MLQERLKKRNQTTYLSKKVPDTFYPPANKPSSGAAWTEAFRLPTTLGSTKPPSTSV